MLYSYPKNTFLFNYGGVPIPCCDEYGEGVGDIHIHGVACDGTEKNITTCALNFNDTAGTSHQQDVRVQCQQG